MTPKRFFQFLHELVDLLREQNSLLRELIQAQTRRPAQTPVSRATPILRPPPPIRPYTAADVLVVTRDRREELALEDQARRTIPWRTQPEDLPAEEREFVESES